MNIKRIFYVILALVLIVSLSACAGASAVPSSIDSEGKFVYAIVRGEEASTTEETVAKKLRSSMKENFDCSITIIKDVVLDDFDGNYEILVGNTNREESAEALELLKSNRLNHNYDFIVAVLNDKICIQAIESDMLTLAGDWFIANYCGSLEDWGKLTTDFCFIYEAEVGSLSNVKINGADLGLYSTTLPRKCSYLVGLPAEEYREFLSGYGYSVSFIEEQVDEHPEYEILYGDCDAKASKSVKVEGDNYVIKVVGNKVVIKGGSDLATNRAGRAFLDEIKKAFLNNTEINWSDGYTINGKYDSEEDGTFILTWNDEFEGNTVDYNKWSGYNNEAAKDPTDSCLGGKIYTQNVTGETNYKGTLEHDLYYVADGKMAIGTMRLNDTDFISSRAGTFSTMIFRYGVLEVYQKIADTPANGSLWVNGGNFTEDSYLRFGKEAIVRSAMTEIDLLENFGSPNSFASNVHRWWGETSATGKNTNHHNSMDGDAQYAAKSDNSKRFDYTERYGDMLHEDYHYYSFYWGPDYIKFAFDGKIFCDYRYTSEDSVSVHQSMGYFLTGCSMGEPAYGKTYNRDNHATYLEHSMDFIRIYQIENENSQMITAWPEKQKTGTTNVVFPNNSIGGY